MFDNLWGVITSPVNDAVEVLDGLSEGELRLKAATRLGTDVAVGMTIEEIIEALS